MITLALILAINFEVPRERSIYEAMNQSVEFPIVRFWDGSAVVNGGDAANNAIRVNCVVGCGGGSITANQGTPAAQSNRWPVFISDGTAERIGQQVMASSLPVVIASNQSAVSITATDLDTRNLVAAQDTVVASQNAIASANNDGACVSVTTSSTTILASFSTARCRIIFARETNTAIVHIKLGATATTADFPMPPSSAENYCSGQIYTGIIDAIAASGTQSICVKEF